MFITLCFFSVLNLVVGNLTLRIVGGSDVLNGDYTFVVRMELMVYYKSLNTEKIRNVHLCTGALLSPEWILTSARCLDQYRHLLPNTKFNKTTILYQEKVIKAVIRYNSMSTKPGLNDSFSEMNYYMKHPAYRVTFNYQYKTWIQYIHNDIGLVNIQPVRIKIYAKLSGVDFSSLAGHQVSICGYGLTVNNVVEIRDTLYLRKPLQMLNVVVRRCKSSYGTRIYPSLCIARQCGKSASICPGDSGGPVLHPTGVIGINSMSIISDCYVNDQDRSYTVGIITPLSPFNDWISDCISRSI